MDATPWRTTSLVLDAFYHEGFLIHSCSHVLEHLHERTTVYYTPVMYLDGVWCISFLDLPQFTHAL